MINNKVTSNSLQSQLVKTQKNKKRVIPRKSKLKFPLIPLMGNTIPDNIQHEIGIKIANTFKSLTGRARDNIRILLREIKRSGKSVKDKSSSYFASAAGYKNEKSNARNVKILEELSVIVVTQYYKKPNEYEIGPALDLDIVKNYLIRFIPSIRLFFPFIFASCMLASSPSKEEENVTGRNVRLLSMLYKDLNLKRDCASQEVINITKKKEERQIGINPKEYREEKTVRTPIPAAKIYSNEPRRILDRRQTGISIGELMRVFTEEKEPINKQEAYPKDDLQRHFIVEDQPVYRSPSPEAPKDIKASEDLPNTELMLQLLRYREKAMQQGKW